MPVKKANQGAKLDRAVRLYQNFRLADPEFIDNVSFTPPDVCLMIGKLAGVLYDTVRDGRKEQYIHEFSKRAQPILASSWDGRQIYILGGKYDFTQDGIIDK